MEKGKVLSSSSEESSSDRQGATSHVCACVRASRIVGRTGQRAEGQ